MSVTGTGRGADLDGFPLVEGPGASLEQKSHERESRDRCNRKPER